MSQNEDLGKQFNPNIGPKTLTRLMGETPDFMKKN